MRNTVAGVVLALLFLAGLFALPHIFPRENLQTTPADVAAKIEPGFSGVRQIGRWVLTCGPARKKSVPFPFSFGPARPAASDAEDLGRCRTFMAFRRKGAVNEVALLISFRLLGSRQHLAAIVRMPPGIKKGELVTIRLGRKALNLPVSLCEKGSCVAMASLTPRQEGLLYTTPVGEILLPPGPKGKRLAVRVPLPALHAATAAMRRAEAGE